MNGKGSKRRPAAVPASEVNKRWDAINWGKTKQRTFRGHKIEWCPMCEVAMLMCKVCKNNSCNASGCEICRKDSADFHKTNTLTRADLPEADRLEKENKEYMKKHFGMDV